MLMFVYCSHMSIGPSSVIVIIIGNAVRGIQDEVEKAVAMTILSLLVGLIMLVLGFLRLGFLDSVVCKVLSVGFINGIGAVICSGQLIGALGLVAAPGHASFIDNISFLFENVGNSNIYAFYISLASMFMLFGAKFLKFKYPASKFFALFPTAFLLVVVMIPVTYLFELNQKGVSVLGKIEGGFKIPHFTPSEVFVQKEGLVSSLFPSAIIIIIIGFVEVIVAAKRSATKHNYPVSANRELVAFGVTNLISSCFWSFPVLCSLARSSINDTAGAKTQLASVFTAVIVTGVVLWGLPLFTYLPKPAMSSVVFYAASTLFEFHEILFMYKVKAKKEAFFCLVCFLVTVFVSIEAGTLITIALSLIMVVQNSAKPRLALLGRVPLDNRKDQDDESTYVSFPQDSKVQFLNIADYPDAQQIENVLIVKIEESLTFANAGQMRDRLRRVEWHGRLGIHPSEDLKDLVFSYLVFDIENLMYIDST